VSVTVFGPHGFNPLIHRWMRNGATNPAQNQRFHPADGTQEVCFPPVAATAPARWRAIGTRFALLWIKSQA